MYAGIHFITTDFDHKNDLSTALKVKKTNQ